MYIINIFTIRIEETLFDSFQILHKIAFITFWPKLDFRASRSQVQIYSCIDVLQYVVTYVSLSSEAQSVINITFKPMVNMCEILPQEGFFHERAINVRRYNTRLSSGLQQACSQGGASTGGVCPGIFFVRTRVFFRSADMLHFPQ